MTITEARNWAITLIAELDEDHPGFAGHFLRSSHERKQVITAYFALCSRSGFNPVEIDGLTSAKHSRILSLALGEVPLGLRGALSRTARQHHPREYYRVLAEALGTMSSAEQRTFSQLQNLDLDMLNRWLRLPDSLRSKEMAALFADEQEVTDFLGAIQTITEAGIRRRTVLDRLSAVRSRKALSTALHDLIDDLEFTNLPVAGSRSIRAVRTVRELRQAGKVLRNCAGSQIFDVLDGSSYFYILRPEDPIGIVLLEREGGIWVVGDILGRSNRAISQPIAVEVLSYFADVGIPRGVSSRPSPWDPVRRFCRRPGRFE